MKNRRSLTIFTLILSVLASVALLPQMQAAPQVAPPPDGCYPAFTTAEGCNALSLLGSGQGNTGVGWYSLFLVGNANFNTGVGAGTLVLNTGDSNTAVGAAAMLLNTTGTLNTAVGTDALVHNTNATQNTAVGAFALFSNDTGPLNTAIGYQALFANVSGLENTAIGDQALLDNTGNFNVAVGGAALLNNTTGNENTAVGSGALNDTTGNDNTALGFQAGILATEGDGNVYIGAGMSGIAGESDHTYVRNINNTSVSGGGTDTVTINLTTGLLGHATSSRRYKEDINPMDNASQALFALKPVTFRYKKDIDKSQILDYGLIAEDVAKVDPNLAIRDRNGQIESVRYGAINAMLLNEFLKEHKKVEEQRATIAELKSTVAQQRKDFEATIAQQQRGMEAVTARLNEQGAQIQKVSAELEVSKPAAQVVVRVP
jgi:hypothetical protein